MNSNASILVGRRESWFPFSTQASLDPKQFGAVGCILIFCEMKERGRVERERSGDKLLSCFLLSLLSFAFCLYKEKEIRNYLFPC